MLFSTLCSQRWRVALLTISDIFQRSLRLKKHIYTIQRAVQFRCKKGGTIAPPLRTAIVQLQRHPPRWPERTQRTHQPQIISITYGNIKWQRRWKKIRIPQRAVEGPDTDLHASVRLLPDANLPRLFLLLNSSIRDLHIHSTSDSPFSSKNSSFRKNLWESHKPHLRTNTTEVMFIGQRRYVREPGHAQREHCPHVASNL